MPRAWFASREPKLWQTERRLVTGEELNSCKELSPRRNLRFLFEWSSRWSNPYNFSIISLPNILKEVGTSPFRWALEMMQMTHLGWWSLVYLRIPAGEIQSSRLPFALSLQVCWSKSVESGRCGTIHIFSTSRLWFWRASLPQTSHLYSAFIVSGGKISGNLNVF